MKQNKKIKVSKEVSDFIKSHHTHSIDRNKLNETISIFWNDCKYISTSEDCVFEIIFPRNIHNELLNNRLDNETTNNN